MFAYMAHNMCREAITEVVNDVRVAQDVDPPGVTDHSQGHTVCMSDFYNLALQGSSSTISPLPRVLHEHPASARPQGWDGSPRLSPYSP